MWNGVFANIDLRGTHVYSTQTDCVLCPSPLTGSGTDLPVRQTVHHTSRVTDRRVTDLLFCLFGSSCNAVCFGCALGQALPALAWEGLSSCRTFPVGWWCARVPVLQQCRHMTLVCPVLPCFHPTFLHQLFKTVQLSPGPQVFCWWPLMGAAHSLTNCCDCSSCECTRHHMHHSLSTPCPVAAPLA